MSNPRDSGRSLRLGTVGSRSRVARRGSGPLPAGRLHRGGAHRSGVRAGGRRLPRCDGHQALGARCAGRGRSFVREGAAAGGGATAGHGGAGAGVDARCGEGGRGKGDGGGARRRGGIAAHGGGRKCRGCRDGIAHRRRPFRAESNVARGCLRLDPRGGGVSGFVGPHTRPLLRIPLHSDHPFHRYRVSGEGRCSSSSEAGCGTWRRIWRRGRGLGVGARPSTTDSRGRRDHRGPRIGCATLGPVAELDPKFRERSPGASSTTWGPGREGAALTGAGARSFGM